MRDIVLQALRAGALGFSTSRTLGHRAIDGELVPGTFAAEDELFGIGSALAEAGTGVFELAPLGSAGEMLQDAWQEVDWMRRLSAAIGRPVSYVLLQADDDPELWRKQLAASLDACAEGALSIPRSPVARPASSRATTPPCACSPTPGLPGAACPRPVGGRARRRARRPRGAPRHGHVDAIVAGRGRGDGEGVPPHLRARATRPTTSRGRSARWRGWRPHAA